MTAPKKAPTSTAPASKTTVSEVEAEEVRDVDVVAVPSLRADGAPDQTPGFVQLVDPEE